MKRRLAIEKRLHFAFFAGPAVSAVSRFTAALKEVATDGPIGVVA